MDTKFILNKFLQRFFYVLAVFIIEALKTLFSISKRQQQMDKKMTSDHDNITVV